MLGLRLPSALTVGDVVFSSGFENELGAGDGDLPESVSLSSGDSTVTEGAGDEAEGGALPLIGLIARKILPSITLVVTPRERLAGLLSFSPSGYLLIS